MQNVVVDRITRTQHAIRENVWMRIAPLSGNRIHRFHIFEPRSYRTLLTNPTASFSRHAGLHRSVEFVVAASTIIAESIEQRDLVLRLDHPHFRTSVPAVDDGQAFPLQRK